MAKLNKGNYSANADGEQERLELQAEYLRDFDLKVFTQALDRFSIYPSFGLDLGCSRGYATFNRFSEFSSFKRVSGIDIDSISLDYAAKRAENEQISYRFRQASLEGEAFAEVLAEELSSITEPVFVWSAFVFHFFSDPVSVLKVIREGLPKGSVIAIRTIDDSTPIVHPNPNRLLERVALRDYSSPHDLSRRIHARKLTEQLQAAGFENVEMVSETILSSGMDAQEKEEMRLIWFSFYRQVALRMAEEFENSQRETFLRDYDQIVEEQKAIFQRDDFFMFANLFAGIASV